MAVSNVEEQQMLMAIEKVLGAYDENITSSNLLSIADSLDVKYSNLNFVLSCADEILTISYFDNQGHGGRFHFGLSERAPVAPCFIN